MHKSHKQIIENIFSLGLINGINLLIPLVTLPYLIKTVGIGNYGAYSIVYAMLQYGILFTAYGFSFSTTQQIAQNRENLDEVTKIMNATLISRILIMLAYIIVMGTVCLIAYPKEYFIMYLWGLGIVLGDILNPTWVYQGMEKMRFMTVINLISKTIFTVLIFVFIKHTEDYPYITLLNSVGYLMAGGISLIMAYRTFDLSFKFPSRSDIVHQFQSGWYIFLSTISMNLYRNSNIFILGFFLSPSLVGIYSGAEKVIKAFQAIVYPISNALFPYVARSFIIQNRSQQWRSIRKMGLYMGTFLLILSAGAYFTAPLTNKLLLDDMDLGAVKLIRILTPVIFFGGLNYILGIVGLVNAGEKKAFFRCVMISGIASVIILLLLVTPCGVNSGGIAMSTCEIILFVMCIWEWHISRKKSKLSISD